MTASPAPTLKIRTRASRVRPGQRVWPRRCGPYATGYVASSWLAVRHDPDGTLVIRSGKRFRWLPKGHTVLTLAAEDPALA